MKAREKNRLKEEIPPLCSNNAEKIVFIKNRPLFYEGKIILVKSDVFSKRRILFVKVLRGMKREKKAVF